MATNIVTSTDKVLVSRHIFADILQNVATGQKSLHATVSISAGDAIIDFEAASVLDHPTYLTIQIAVDKHITLLPEFLQYTNHSCEPNVFFNTDSMELVCVKNIEPGDEITFFYPSTEWEMAQPFVCSCGTDKCLQLINGAFNLTVETLSRYKLTDFIKQQVRQKLSL
jgi:hypothetical protein